MFYFENSLWHFTVWFNLCCANWDDWVPLPPKKLVPFGTHPQFWWSALRPNLHLNTILASQQYQARAMVNCETLLGVCEVVSVTKTSWTHKAIETCLVVLSFHRQTTAREQPNKHLHNNIYFLLVLIYRHIHSFSKLRNWKTVPQTTHHGIHVPLKRTDGKSQVQLCSWLYIADNCRSLIWTGKNGFD